MPWHVTPKENLTSILKDGLIPAIGPRSEDCGEDTPAVHLFSTFGDLEDAQWLWDAFDEDDQLALVHASVPPAPGSWTEVAECITPERLLVLSEDLFNVSDSNFPLFRSLDGISDPFSSLEDFTSTRVELPADLFWKSHDARARADSDPLSGMEIPDSPTLLVYGACYFIEKAGDDLCSMPIHGDRFASRNGYSIQAIERVIFDFALSERRAGPEQSPSP
ncbi:hypothetical protein ACEUZ9_004670 [Paracoccus litorisediminis]|uniref:hypothetical protein n=1 Tax=Paracoccus litorisediminis TaxID=2006130 RepID=UPI0037303C48